MSEERRRGRRARSAASDDAVIAGVPEDGAEVTTASDAVGAGTEANPEADSANEASSRPPRSRRFWIWAGVAAAGVLILAWGVVVGVSALQVRDDLAAAIPLTDQLKEQALAQDLDGARATLDEIDAKVDHASALVGSPLWRWAEIAPFAGQNLSAVRQLTEITAAIVDDAVDPLVGVAGSLDLSAITMKDGAIDITPLAEIESVVSRADETVTAATEKLDAIGDFALIGAVSSAKTQLGDALSQLASPLRAASSALPMLAPALGYDGQRNYLVVFQNPAEARPLGGMIGAVALVTVDNGRISLGTQIAGSDDVFDYHGAPNIEVPADAEAIFGDGYGSSMTNATVSPRFDVAAETVMAMWKRISVDPIDGVFSLDPIALGYIMRATGPIPSITGETVDSTNLVPLLLNDVYQKYSPEIQDAIYAGLVQSMFGSISDGAFEMPVLVDALTQSIGERRLLGWSAMTGEEALFATLGLDGALPESDEQTQRLGVYVSDNVGSKLNYYLHQGVDIASASCRVDGRINYRADIHLTSAVPADPARSLDEYITYGAKAENLPVGNMRMWTYYYVPPGAHLEAAYLDGAPLDYEKFMDGDYEVLKLRVELLPGQTQTVTLDLVSDSTVRHAFEAVVTPLVNPTTVTKRELDCAAVAGE